MKIIVSPAKQMKVNNDFMEAGQPPQLLGQTKVLMQALKKKSRKELKELLCANDKIIEENYWRYQTMDLEKGLTPAVLAYSGLAFSYMAPQVFTDSQWAFAEKNLKILSGFYGILNALDGIVPYRLEMQAKLSVCGSANLYQYWGDRLYRLLAQEVRRDTGEGRERVILNLASKEYSSALEPYVEEDIRFVTCIFGELADGKLKTKGTRAKMARGQMAAWLAGIQADDLEQVKDFRDLGYTYRKDRSSSRELVFLLEDNTK